MQTLLCSNIIYWHWNRLEQFVLGPPQQPTMLRDSSVWTPDTQRSFTLG